MSGRKNASNAPANGKAASPALARSVNLHLQGKRSEALREINTAIESGEESAEILAAKGHLQFELEQYDDAAQDLREAHRSGAQPPHRQLQSRHLLREGRPLAGSHGFLYQGPQRRSAAEGSAARPGHLPCYIRKSLEPAIECFDKVLASQPDLESALFGKAVSLQLLWKFDEATALFISRFLQRIRSRKSAS